MGENVKKMLDYVPKSERERESIYDNPLESLAAYTPPVGSPYKEIQVINQSLDTIVSLDPEAAYSAYKQLTMARHNIWYSALWSNRLRNWLSGEMETNLTGFCTEVLKVEITDTTIATKTPDLMFYDPNEGTVLLGDVAVTKSEPTVTAIKHTKYEPIDNWLRQQGFRVLHLDFVLKEDGSNVSTLLNKFKENRIINVSYNSQTDMHFTLCANMLMETVMNLCTDLQAFNLVNEKASADQFKNPIGIKTLFDANIQLEALPIFKPKVTEQQLITMIKNKVDSVDVDLLFDMDPNTVQLAFNNIIEANKVKPICTPKSVLKVVDNSMHMEMNDIELLNDYLDDLMPSNPCEVRDYILGLLPSSTQAYIMMQIKSKKQTYRDVKNDKKCIEAGVGGRYQYKRAKTEANSLLSDFEGKVRLGSKRNRVPNRKKEPKTIDMDSLTSFKSFMNCSIDYYGTISNKPSFLNDDWDIANKNEADNTIKDKEAYYYVKATNGAQLCNSLSGLYNRISHMSSSLGRYDNVYIPPNGSFIAVMPGEHAPVTSSNCDMPFIFLTRVKHGSQLSHIEYEHKCETHKYTYYVSKLSRLNVRKISCWDNAGFRLVASSSFLLARCPSLWTSKEKVVGLLTYLTIDVHQKVSEYLDLLKYISFMPFADLHMLPKLVEDKCDLLMKTKMDAWMFLQLRDYVLKLSDKKELKAEKPKVIIEDGKMSKESLGIDIQLPSFIDLNIRHTEAKEFIEEIKLLHTSRPKHLYGSQFMDTAITLTAQWNREYDIEKDKYGQWLTTGQGEGAYPFEAKFAFSADAIHYATNLLMRHIRAGASKIESQLYGSTYGDFMHTNCSLRGCTKARVDRQNARDIHTTSIGECLEEYKKQNYNDEKCRTLTIGQSFILSNEQMEFSMSEKDQRGGGRPIATPTLGAKAALMLIEKPEASLGFHMPNNILVAGKNKLQEQYLAYTSCLSDGFRRRFRQVYQLTEDQTKYSENDNCHKYIPYILSNTLLPVEVRKVQLAALSKIHNRVHLVKRLPIGILEDSNLSSEVVQEPYRLGVKSRIGWPQGMLNNISTSVHCAADYWITDIFKKAYPKERIETRGCVHSDDSWVVVCCDNLETFRKFSVFRMYAKKLMCLKMNEKKLWGGRYLGELVSNYNLNGEVHLSTASVICNGMSNLTYQNWPIDVSNQISTIQQSYRSGATIGNITMLATVLKQQIFAAYQVDGLQQKLINKLPIELGGYPSGSAFRLAICGTSAHYSDINRMLSYSTENDADREDATIVEEILTAACHVSQVRMESIFSGSDSGGINRDDYIGVELPDKGEVFKGIRHLMPRSRKITYAMKSISDVAARFPSNGLGLIIRNPRTLAESLGHFSDTTKSRLYSLAAERYTQSSRRLAISQTMQSRGKVVCINNGPPLTFEECYNVLRNTKVRPIDKTLMKEAFRENSDIVMTCDSIINTGTLELTTNKKKSVINKMPEINDIYKTVTPLRDVLLYIIDDAHDGITNYFVIYGSNLTSVSTVKNDANIIKSRFASYFNYFEVKESCRLIMQGKLSSVRERSWVQPKVNNSNLNTFLEGLYGVTLNKELTYKVRTDNRYRAKATVDNDIVQSIYSTLILNELYEGKFKMTSIKGKSVKDSLDDIDYNKLDRNTLKKYCICQFVLYDNSDYIAKHVDSEEFNYKWITKQYRHNTYEGDWEIEFRYNTLSARIRCILGDIVLTVNKADLRLILRGLHLMVMHCFRDESYQYDSAWGKCKRLSSTKTDYQTMSYLCWNNYYDSSINMTPTKTFINLQIQESLIFARGQEQFKPEVTYEVTNNLRVIRAVTSDSGGNREVYRVSNVHQNFDIPLHDTIEVQTEYIDGVPNFLLMKTGVIIDITLGRPLTVQRSTLYYILDNCITKPQVEVLWKTFSNICNCTKNMQNLMPEFTFEKKQATIQEVTMDIELTPLSVEAIAEVAKTTEVESLEGIIREYKADRLEGSKKLYLSKDILRILCSNMFINDSESEVLDTIFGIINNQNIIKWARQFLSDIDEAKVINKEVNDGELEFWYSNELFYYLYGKELDITAFWSKVNRGTMDDRLRDSRNIAKKSELIREFVMKCGEFYSGYVEKVKPSFFDSLSDLI